MKVSADGATWREAINIDPTTAVVSFPSGAARLPSYAKATALNAATAGTGATIHVTDATGGLSICVSNGGAGKKMLLLSTDMA